MTASFPGVSQWWRLSLRRGFSAAKRLGLTAFLAALLISALALPILIFTQGVSEASGGNQSQLNVISVSPSPDSPDTGIPSAAVEEIRGVDGVADVVIDLSATISAAEDGMWDASAHVARPWLMPPGVETVKLTGNEVVMPSELDGTDMTAFVGEDLRVGYTRAVSADKGTLDELVVRVVDTYPATWTGYGPKAALASQDLVIELYGARYALTKDEVMNREGVPGVWVQTNGADDVDPVLATLTDMGYDVIAERDRAGALPGLLAAFPLVLTAVSVGMVALLATQIFQAVRSSISGRAGEFGLLRMRGYGTADIRKLITLEVVSGVAGGALIGVLVGSVAGWFLAGVVTPEEFGMARMPILAISSCLLALLAGICLLALLAALVSSARINREDPFLLVLRN
ncbi:MAG: ABC transporter permease [Flaviflexus sp.]|nr:ABC transporter permease [Flaviflexus sp.]